MSPPRERSVDSAETPLKKSAANTAGLKLDLEKPEAHENQIQLNVGSPLVDFRLVRPRPEMVFSKNGFLANRARDFAISASTTPTVDVDFTVILQARLRNCKDRLSELEGLIQMEKKAVESLKLRRNKIRSFILHVLQTLFKHPVEALEYEISIKTIVKYLQEIGESPNPDFLGGSFTPEEKHLIIGLALMQNQWVKAKAFLQAQHKRDMLESMESVRRVFTKLDDLKTVEQNPLPAPDTLVSQVCRQGVSATREYFDLRKSKFLETQNRQTAQGAGREHSPAFGGGGQSGGDPSTSHVD